MASSLVTAYGILWKKPAWTITRAAILGGLSGAGGSAGGQFLRLRAHADFVRSLDDRDGFLQAMSNVHDRLNGSPLKDFEQIRNRRDSGATSENNPEQSSCKYMDNAYASVI